MLVADVAEPVIGEREGDLAGGGLRVGEGKSAEERRRKKRGRTGTNQWILLVSSNKPSAIECTGASPQRS